MAEQGGKGQPYRILLDVVARLGCVLEGETMAAVVGVVILAALVGAHGAFWLSCHQNR
jgi:hypothetical protein